MNEQLRARAARWNVTIEETRETHSSVLGFGVRDGRGVVLKLTKGAGDEARSGEVLRRFGGSGAVRVFESEFRAVLLERLEPGEELVNLVRRGDDDEATRILAQVIEKLVSHQTPATTQTVPAGIPTVIDWSRSFEGYVQSRNQEVPAELVREAHAFYCDLADSQRTTLLLHGDLQHYNVLYDYKRGWLAIDPKGVVGELEYEIGALMRNPTEQPALFANRNTIERRLNILTSALSLDHARTLRWCFAQAVLSAIWSVQDGFPVEHNHPALQLARTIRPMLD